MIAKFANCGIFMNIWIYECQQSLNKTHKETHTENPGKTKTSEQLAKGFSVRLSASF